jgi:hypothetical protein
MSVAPEVAVVAAVAVAAVVAAEVDVVPFLPRLDGTLVASVAAVFFWFFLPPADMEVADEASALFLAARVGREVWLEVEGAI